MRLCPCSLALASSIPVLGLERVCPRKGCLWPWPRIFFCVLGLEPCVSTPPLMSTKTIIFIYAIFRDIIEPKTTAFIAPPFFENAKLSKNCESFSIFKKNHTSALRRIKHILLVWTVLFLFCLMRMDPKRWKISLNTGELLIVWIYRYVSYSYVAVGLSIFPVVG